MRRIVRWTVLVWIAGTLVGAAETPTLVFEQAGEVLKVKHGGRILAVSLQMPELSFDREHAPPSAAITSVSGDLGNAAGLQVEYAPAELAPGVTLDVTAHLLWTPTEGILRKWARLRLNGADSPWSLAEVVLDRLPAPNAAFLPSPPQSYPAFLEGAFAGIEYPVATTRLEGDALVLAHAPGSTLEPGQGYETRKAIYGFANPGQEREAFMRYIAQHRPAPGGFHANYNSWWTSSVPFTEEEILGLMRTFKERLYDAYGVALDTFAIDMGWSDPHSIWKISQERFPQGFSNISAAAAEMGCHLGLWTSPTAFYAKALDPQWARDQGYETLVVSGQLYSERRICCLGGEKYAGAFRDQLVALVRDYGIRHVKLDGYRLTCSETGHGHQPGVLSSEAIAEGGIAAFEAMRAAAPDVWLETTCFGWNPSPWWLFHVNSVIGAFGDDSPYPRVPSPVYWESKLTARDFFNLQGAALLPIPDAAQEVLGLIVQTDDPWLNEGVVVATRGHMLMPLYVNPRYMNARRWEQLAGLLKWARANEELLAYDTVPLLPEAWQGGKVPRFDNDATMPRQPYGYAHWKGEQGLVTLRNPWIRPASYPLHFDADTPQPLQVVSLYPEVRVYAEDVQAGSLLEVPLAPYETLVLAVGPGLDTDGVQPAAACLADTLEAKEVQVERIRYVYEASDAPALGPDYTDVTPESGEETRVSLTAQVVSTAPATELLVLLEGPETPGAPEAELFIDGAPVEWQVGPSEAGWAASSIARSREHWLFLRAPVPAGTHGLAMSVIPDDSVEHVSAWLWTYRDGADTTYPGALPAPEQVSIGALPLLEPLSPQEAGPAEQRPRRIERIDGVYLDALEPESAAQGWGTLQKNHSVTEKPLRIGHRAFRRGLGTHAAARLVYALDGQYRTFESYVGVDAAYGGTVHFRVLVDGAERWNSGVMRSQEPAQHLRVDLTGAQRLELIADDAGDGIGADHADFGDAKLLH